MAINTLATATLFMTQVRLMRLRRNRLEEFFHKKMTVKKDKEGSTSEEYGAASSVTGESWPASGKVQAEQYGQRLNYIRNIRIQGSYKIQTDEKGRLHYILEDGTDIEERDGICLYVAADQLPDYATYQLGLGRWIYKNR